MRACIYLRSHAKAVGTLAAAGMDDSASINIKTLANSSIKQVHQRCTQVTRSTVAHLDLCGIGVPPNLDGH
jgi:hypothetical protein